MNQLQNNRIILAAVNARYTHSNLALLYLRQYADGLHYDIDIREFTIQQNASDIVSALIKEKPGAAAFSVYIWNSELIKSIIVLLKEELKDCMIICGGPEVSYNYKKWLENIPVDYIVTGKGEGGFRELLERGVSWDGPIVDVANPHFSMIPMPYMESDFDRLAHRYVYYESSRGCPFRCSYCLSSMDDQRLELRDLPVVLEEIDFIAAHRPHTVKFVDRSFNAAKENARTIWKHCMEQHADRGIQFHFELHPSLLDEDDLLVLSRAPRGLFRFEIGLQSTNPDTLGAIGRVQEWERAREMVARLVSMKKFHVHLDLIAGLPFEDLSSAANSFNDVCALGADYLQLGFLKVLPGTEIDRKAQEYGIEHDMKPPYRIVKNRWLSAGDLSELDAVAHMVNVMYNGGRFHVTMEELLRLHDAPYSMFRNMARYFKGCAGMPGRDWTQCGSFISEYVRNEFPGEMDFINDCLRWDWCTVHAPRRYPPFLRIGIARKSRRDFRLRTRNLESRGRGGDVIIFEPETVRFREKYMNGLDAEVFAGKKGMVR